MKLIVFLLLMITAFQRLNSNYSEKLRFSVREINVDTANFKLNVLEKNDLSFLIQISNPTNRGIVLRKPDSLQFNAWLKFNKETRRAIRMNVFFSPVFRQDGKGQNSDLVIRAKGSDYFVIGLSCLNLKEYNRNYMYLEKAQKLNYLLALINNIKIKYGNELLGIDRKRTKILYRSLYGPHDPGKPYPLYPKPLIVK